VRVALGSSGSGVPHHRACRQLDEFEALVCAKTALPKKPRIAAAASIHFSGGGGRVAALDSLRALHPE
jgi:hypothetical protein